MTEIAEPLLPAPAPRAERPTLYDRWVARVSGDPRLARLWRWLAPTLVTVVAGILRLWNLGNPHELAFDETYYVKDAWSQWNLGYASTWPEGADESFEAGDTDIFTGTGSFVVHPPLGKLLIGAGMALFGADSSFGWRFATAIFGTALVLLLYLVAKTLTNSVPFAVTASGLMAIDGLAIVMSRVALLDVFLAFFVLLAFWFVLLDRGRFLQRLDAAVEARTTDDGPPDWGPVLWNRPWIIAAGAAVGAATAVKWSGLYVAASLGIYLVVTDALARRRAGVQQWPMDAVRQGLATFVLLVPVAFVVYLASWTSWLVTDGGYGRHAITEAGDGFWSWVPLPLQNLWKYHEAIYGFHVGLTTPHGYQSPAWQWPLLVRPTSMFFHRDDAVQNVYSMPNPFIWWGAVAAVIYLVWRFVVARDWRYAFVLTGVAATYVPWLLYPERTIFQFYTIAILPFMLLALAFALRDVAGRRAKDDYRRRTGQHLVWLYLGFVLALSIFWYPILTATGVPWWFYQVHNWFPTWI
ncbi:phospholipid carrier-dependent glycosyltransferase [Microbacterium aoyamense]|uniref:Polyprenol-phosphate-mannose--protein mannosyltransferase n=1 Tax=Microbacterium aoyamense TaxID=344166 RepID=A0ABP5BC30_9MICO|nr:phospholipid carrier-dependent glycosyltransferase [Microbacterium aoyamense]